MLTAATRWSRPRCSTRSRGRSRPEWTSSAKARWASRASSTTPMIGSAVSSARRPTPNPCGRAPVRPMHFRNSTESEIKNIDRRLRMQCVAPITYKGHALIQEDIRLLKSALAGKRYEDIFVPSVSPSLLANYQRNLFYKTNEEYVFAVAEAMREEYLAIVDAGCHRADRRPGIALPSHAQSRPDHGGMAQVGGHAGRRAQQRAARHTAGENPAPHLPRHQYGPAGHEMEFKDHVEIVLKINAGGYSFEAANPRHEHEWRVWETLKLPQARSSSPGSSPSRRCWSSTPCWSPTGSSVSPTWSAGRTSSPAPIAALPAARRRQEIHLTVVWAKLDALVEGARIASQRLWKSQKVA